MISSKKKRSTRLKHNKDPTQSIVELVRSKMALYMAVSVLFFFPVFVLYFAVVLQVVPTRQQPLRISQSSLSSSSQVSTHSEFFLKSWLEAQLLFVGSIGEPDWEMCRYACQALTGLQALLSCIYLANIRYLAN
ncbi:hypothetical protein ILYODFUR_036305 [Ilyodon furcidens]|uniref:Uncharacterized protein n=1 Tax=Ilyodon furcidens TaxID=33524 RepID=A0ABV0VKP3_9TELE